MRSLLVAAAGLAAAGADSPIPMDIGSPELRCAVYKLAHEFASVVQPKITATQSRAVYDALQLDNCSKSERAPLPRASLPEPAPAERTAGPHAAGSIYVDAAKGSDSAAGSLGAPLKTIEAAHAKARQRSGSATIVLRGGTYYLKETLALTAQDSGLTIESYTGEVAEVSGAHPLGKLAWTAHNTSGGQNVYSAKLPKSALPSGDMTGLRVDGKRGIRARWPNGDPEYQLFPDGWVADNGWQKPKTFPQTENIEVMSPNRSTEGPCASVNGYCYYTTGVGGACAGYGFEPPSGYWCLTDPPRGKGYSVAFPSALDYNAKGASKDFQWPSFKPNRTVINAFRQGHWFSYVFLVDKYDGSAKTMSWTKGGFQGGEGASGASEWNVENAMEEL